MRIKIINWAIFFSFLFLFFTIFNLGIVQHKKFKDLSNKNCIRLISQEGSRGKILDRKGNLIAGNNLEYNAMILPQRDLPGDEVLAKAASILETDFSGLKNKLKDYFFASSLPITLAKNVDIKKAMALEELKPNLNSIIIQPQPVRAYPYAGLACHLLGYLNEIDRWRLTKLTDYGYKTRDIVGFGGVEEVYDYYLHQEEGGQSIEVDNRGRSVRVLGFRPARDGKDIQLTIDLKIQKIVEEKLSGKIGSVIIMDPISGEIIALASGPGFNPSVFVRKSSASIRNLLSNPAAPLINRAISGLYPAGSVFKLIVAVAGLETGKINLSKEFTCLGSINIGRQEFSCWNTHGQQNLYQAITHSCNVFFYRTGLLVGAQTIHDYAVKFGLGKTTSIDLPYEEDGFLPDPLWRKLYRFKSWFDGDTANLAIGQGELLVTPLQIARMMAVFANRGYLVTPYIVKSVDNQDISLYRKKISRMPIKESTINYIRQALRDVVLEPSGTGHVLSIPDIAIAGKTGTAQVSRGQAHAWFVGFFPFKNPKYVICVFLEHGGPGYYSCLLAREIIEEMLKENLI